MPNYKETTETGTIVKWTRSPQMVLDNPIDGTPSAMVYITDAKRYPDGSAAEKSIGSAHYALTDPSVEIPLIDPDTYEPTDQTFPAGHFWLMSASVALWLMRQQDGEL